MSRNGRGSVPPSTPEQQEEMSVFIVRLKGGSGTLQKGFDAMKDAFAAMGQATGSGQPKRLAPTAPPSNGSSSIENREPEDDENSESGEVIDAPPTSRPPASKGPRKYKFLDAFDLTVSDTPWKVFASNKGTKSDNECYLVAAQWLTENAATPEFSAAHMFTLFRAAKWNEQADFTVPMRKMKSKSSYFDNPTPKTWKLTGIGLDAARAVKPASAE